jgi:hypothetical protein
VRDDVLDDELANMSQASRLYGIVIHNTDVSINGMDSSRADVRVSERALLLILRLENR